MRGPAAAFTGGNPGGGLTRAEWAAIVQHMYDADDAATLLRRLQRVVLLRAAAVTFRCHLLADSHATLQTPGDATSLGGVSGSLCAVSDVFPDGSWATYPHMVDTALATHQRLVHTLAALPSVEIDRIAAAVNRAGWLPWDSVLHLSLIHI